MQSGKLNWDDLKEIINNNKGVLREEVKVRNSIGEDCAVIDFDRELCILSTDPITGASSNIGKLAVNINCNDLASSGGEPIAILVTILAPEGTSLEEIKLLMREIHQEAKKLNLEIIGGHTEVTAAVNKMVVSCTAIGKSRKGKAITTSGAQLGDDIVVTKKLAMEGTVILINEYREKLEEILSSEEIKEGLDYINYISVLKEGNIGARMEVNSMHDITEGGLLGALWEVAEASYKGFEIYEHKLPLSNVTKKLCTYLNLDPLRLISSGSMLITTSNGQQLVEELKSHGIEGTIIGKITEQKGYVINSQGRILVQPPERDELFKAHQ